MKIAQLFRPLTMICAAGCLMLAAAPARAGDVQLSTLGRPNNPFYNIGNDAMFAQSFITGSAAGGSWDLGSVTLSLGDADAGMPPFEVGTLGVFDVSIYASDPTSSAPSSLVATLSGSTSPTVSGDYVYSATSTTLSAGTQYWIVMTQIGGDNAAYRGRMSSDSSLTFTTASNDWTVDTNHSTALSFDSGNSWSLFSYTANSANIFAVEATPTAVPEPATYALLAGLGALGLVALRRRAAR